MREPKTHMKRNVIAVALAAWILGGCIGGQPAVGQDDVVSAFLSGNVTVSAEIDSTVNYEGFEIIVARSTESGIDTLGYAVSDSAGYFETAVVAEQRGLFSLLVKRLGEVLSTTEFVVAVGDSSTFQATYPLQGRLPKVRSFENAAWMAYRNTDIQHNQEVMNVLKEGEGDQELLGMAIRRTADLFWSLRTTFPGTLGASAAAVRSVTILEGWNDSLVVARSADIPSSAPGFVEAIRAAHRATARLSGLQEAISFVERAMSKAEDREAMAALEATIVQAHMDSLQSDMAAVTARSIQKSYEGSLWAVWAERAEYEAKNLMPGMVAPDFETRTRSDSLFKLSSLSGNKVVLEFWDPQDVTYSEQAPQIAALARELGNEVAWVSIALNPDIDLIEAFFEGRDLPGIKLQDTSYFDSEPARLYNVNSLPTRYLLDEQRRIVRRYVGDSFYRLVEDLQSDDPQNP